MSKTLEQLDVGSIVKCKVDNQDVEWIVVHQGRPSEDYDVSCDGTWLLMKSGYWNPDEDDGKIFFNSTPPKYADYRLSSINAFANGEYLQKFSTAMQNTIKTVKIPVFTDHKYSSSLLSGSNGFETKIFLLSHTEVGFIDSYFDTPQCGTKLSYFLEGTNTSANTKRKIGTITRPNSTTSSDTPYWLRVPFSKGSANKEVCGIARSGGGDWYNCDSFECYFRPAMILSYDTPLDNNNNIALNEAPVINCDDTNLGNINSNFVVSYTITDTENDNCTVKEKIDGKEIRTYSITNDTSSDHHLGNTERLIISQEVFLKLAKGEHTLTIEASDGMGSSTHSIVFNKIVDTVTISLTTPIKSNSAITLCDIAVNGDLKSDNDLLVEVTNNGKDDIIEWEDCTSEALSGSVYNFINQTALNGYAFNYRVTVKDAGREGENADYIESITGGFQ